MQLVLKGLMYLEVCSIQASLTFYANIPYPELTTILYLPLPYYQQLEPCISRVL
jgi:hypothetical protein